jgi:hypothetical protein
MPAETARLVTLKVQMLEIDYIIVTIDAIDTIDTIDTRTVYVSLQNAKSIFIKL